MKFNVIYWYQGDKMNAGQYANKTEARTRVTEVRAAGFHSVSIEPVYPLPASQR
jgi:hypothetical protein